MLRILFSLIGLWSFSAFALPCDCQVVVFSPMTGSHQWEPNVLQTYELEEYGTYAVKNQRDCRKRCLDQFFKDMPTSRLRALLLSYSQELIDQGHLGHNCTGLTTLKYPVRVKARLGRLALGNVEDRMEVVNHEEICF